MELRNSLLSNINDDGDNNEKNLKTWVGIFKKMGGNVLGGNFLGGNFPGVNFPRGSLMGENFCEWEFFRVGFFLIPVLII